MTGQMAIGIALPGFNDLGRSVTPIFRKAQNCLWLTLLRSLPCFRSLF